MSIGAGPRRSEPPRADGSPLHVLVVADCSGRAARGIREPLGARRAQKVDVDRWDGVAAAWRARIDTPLRSAEGEPVWLEPASLDDLHPDRLLEQLPPLAEIASALQALSSDPGAATRLEALLGRSVAEAPPTGLAGSASGAESSSDTLSRLLGASASPERGRPEPTARQPVGKVDIEPFIRAIIGGSAPSKQAPSERTGALRAAAEAELGRRARLVLAAPALRKLEATWRGIDGLCRNCPDEERVHLSVLDASFDELAADGAGLSALLERVTPTVLLVDHEFTSEPGPLRVLSQWAELCQSKGVQLLAAAHPHLAGCAHFAEVSEPEENAWILPAEAVDAWAELLGARERGARFALALPRFCSRQPYGASGEPIERFAFEEILDASDHDAFPWSNGAYLLARAVAVRFVGDRAAPGREHRAARAAPHLSGRRRRKPDQAVH